VGITKRCLPIIEEWKRKLHNRRDVAMFENLSKQRITDAWKVMKDHVGIAEAECVPYSLRHTFGTRSILSGIDVDRLQYLMGHSTSAMTKKYVHLARLVENEAVEKLDRFLMGEQ
jgi:site-specific recombinase XerD